MEIMYIIKAIPLIILLTGGIFIGITYDDNLNNFK